MSDRVARLLSTVGGLGDRLPAPGTTVGSLAGVVLFFVVTIVGPAAALWQCVVGIAVLIPTAVWACGREASRRGSADPQPVVLDEVAGQWTALLLITATRQQPPSATGYVVSFLLFRVFDVVKPWPIRSLERLPGGLGIVADDLAAGVLAGALHLALLQITPPAWS